MHVDELLAGPFLMTCPIGAGGGDSRISIFQQNDRKTHGKLNQTTTSEQQNLVFERKPFAFGDIDPLTRLGLRPLSLAK